MTIAEPEQLGTLIRRLRLASGLSQEQVAERSGLSARAVSDLERGQRTHTRPETLRMLAEGLDLGDDDRRTLLQAARPELRPPPGIATTGRLIESGLPTPPARLIGREGEVTALVSRLTHGDGQLTTLTGPGGVGKTRLALEAARQAATHYSDGPVFVDLSPVTNVDLVPSAIAQALRIRESGEQPIAETLRIALRNRRLLLLLDNFEQVIEAAPLIGELLAGSPDLNVLVTSREALRIRGEHEVIVDPLDLPTARDATNLDQLAKSAAVELFVMTAISAKPGFALTTDNADAVIGICRRLDGLPLAIELAASRVRHFPPTVLLERLGQRLPVLTGGSRDLPARQQTLRDTIAWSYNLLPADEQTLFRWVGAFPGGASLAALDTYEKVAGPLDLDLLSGLASLADKSLLLERMGVDGTPRFSMLETIREFAGEMIAGEGELGTSRSAVVAWALEFVRSGKGGTLAFLLGNANLQLIEEEIDNVRAGFAFAADREAAEPAAQVFVGVNGYLYVRGLCREGLTMGQKVLELARTSTIPNSIRGGVLTNLSNQWMTIVDLPGAERLAREGLELTLRSDGNATQSIQAFHALVMTLRDQGRYAEALAYAEQADALAATPADESWRALTKYAMGRVSYLMDDQQRAVENLSDAVERSLQFGANELAVYAGTTLVAARVRRGELLDAASTLRQVVRLRQEAGSSAQGLFLSEAGFLAAASLRPDIAATLFAAESAHDTMFGMLELHDRWVNDAKESVRSQMGDEAFESASRAGQALSLDAAIELVLDLIDDIEEESTAGSHA